MHYTHTHLYSIVEVVEHRVDSNGERKKLGQTGYCLDTNGTIYVTQRLQVGGLELWQK